MSPLRGFGTLGKPALVLGLLAGGLVASTALAERLSQPSVNAMETTKLVGRMMPRYHLSAPTLDDAYSARFLETYLEALDPTKRYFTRDDVAEFQQYRTVLDDNLKSGNPEFALKAFQRWKDRHRERTDYAMSLLDRDYDFTVDESFISDPDLLDWASPAELDERWRKYIKEQFLQAKLDAETDKIGLLSESDDPIAERRERLRRRYMNQGRLAQDKDESEAVELFLTAAGQVFDPHSTYMSPKTLKGFQDSMRLQLEGIGAALRSEDGDTKVVKIVSPGAAEKDGRLQEGDIIEAVGESKESLEDIVELHLNDVVQKIRGKKGTTVWLKVRPAGGGEAKLIDLVREKIAMDDAKVTGKIIDLAERVGRDYRIGVINIPSFYRDFEGANAGLANFASSGRDVQSVLDDFRREGGIDAIVVDVRNNGGGALTEAIEITGLFIDEGPVVQVRGTDGSVESHNDEDSGASTALPLVVATNRFSASASEIFAGAIKDYRRGIVVGDETTHGKGTVQNVLPVARGMFNFTSKKGALKLTIQQFYRVNGDSTQNRGVPSDISMPSMLDYIESGEEFLDNALPFDQVRPAGYTALRMVSPGLIKQLAAMSAGRIAKSEKFAEVREDIDRYLELKSKTSVSLNFETRKAEREKYRDEEREAERKKELEERDKRDKTDIFPKSHYNDEILNIAADYVEALERATASPSRKAERGASPTRPIGQFQR